VLIGLVCLGSVQAEIGQIDTSGADISTSVTKIPATRMAAHGQWMSLAPPRVASGELESEKLVPIDFDSEPSAQTPGHDKWAQKHHMGPNPRAARKLAMQEARAIEKNKNPAAEKKGTEYAKLLVLLIEFDRDVTDTFVNWERPTDINDPACVTETVDKSGPEHGELPDPATAGSGRDNNTFWVSDFSVEHYQKIMFSEDGLTDRVRTDLTGPDGLPGIDMSGYTMRNYFLENSEGTYDLSGTVVDWLSLPHSQAWYGADSCAGGRASMVGHPDNPRGVQQSVVDAVDALNTREPGFPWVDFDTDEDGVVDHVVINHAGSGEEGGGGADGTYAIWSHSSDVDAAAGGYVACTAGSPGCSPDRDIVVLNYIMQPEDAGVGVFAHEYGHDLGLPDLYDTVSGGSSNVNFWALMSSGSHSGPIFQSMPTHFGIWSKWVLGWADLVITNAARPQSIKVGQTSNPPHGSADGIKINLPDQVSVLSTPHSGEYMWWSNNDANWADARLVQDFDLTGVAGDIEFTFWTDYVIEELWDYAFVEVSTDGGSSWVQLSTASPVIHTAGSRCASTCPLMPEWTSACASGRRPMPDSSSVTCSSTTSRLRMMAAASFLTTPKPMATGPVIPRPLWVSPAKAGSAPPALSACPITTWLSGVTWTASMKACYTATTRPSSTSQLANGWWNVYRTTLRACSSGTGIRLTATTVSTTTPSIRPVWAPKACC
jgi:immune inhibitor A